MILRDWKRTFNPSAAELTYSPIKDRCGNATGRGKETIDLVRFGVEDVRADGQASKTTFGRIGTFVDRRDGVGLGTRLLLKRDRRFRALVNRRRNTDITGVIARVIIPSGRRSRRPSSVRIQRQGAQSIRQKAASIRRDTRQRQYRRGIVDGSLDIDRRRDRVPVAIEGGGGRSGAPATGIATSHSYRHSETHPHRQYDDTRPANRTTASDESASQTARHTPKPPRSCRRLAPSDGDAGRRASARVSSS